MRGLRLGLWATERAVGVLGRELSIGNYWRYPEQTLQKQLSRTARDEEYRPQIYRVSLGPFFRQYSCQGTWSGPEWILLVIFSFVSHRQRNNKLSFIVSTKLYI